jgi:hypothetical protein
LVILVLISILLGGEFMKNDYVDLLTELAIKMKWKGKEFG